MALYSPKKKPPQSPILFTATPVSIMDDARRLIEQSRNVQNQIASSVQPATATFANTILPLAQNENTIRGKAEVIGFYQDVSTNEELRAASSKAQSLLEDFGIEIATREDIFQLVEAALQKNETIDAESRKLLEKEHKSFIRNGLGLPTRAMQDCLKEIKKRVAQIKIDFQRTLNEENGGIWFTEKELNGVPKDVLSELEKGQGENKGKLRLRFKYPETAATLRHATSGETRRQLTIAVANRCNQNVPLLKEAVVLCDKAARLLGYPNHAAFTLEENLAKSPHTVNTFLEGLRSRLSAKGLEEYEKLKQAKKEDLESRGEQFDGHLYLWDRVYYERLALKEHSSYSVEKVSEYFPASTTVQRMLGIFEKLFGLSFVEIIGQDRDDIAETGKGCETVWHPDVQLFTVWDEQGDGFLGYLYIDIYPRTGKFPHARTYLLQPGFIDIDGKRRYPATALVCNLAQPSQKKPSLLKHREVWTLFHELGHTIHDLVGKTKYSHFHGANVAQDFGEAPSQMLENWCWTPFVLNLLSQHYSTLTPEYFKSWKEEQADSDSDNRANTPPEKIPNDMIEGILYAKQANNALFYLDQVRLAIFTMTIYQPESHEMAEKMNISEIWNTLQSDMKMFEGPESQGMGNEWGHGEAAIGHFIHGCNYYGYLMSQVYSLDMYSTYFKSDLMNGTEGRRYRRMVLEKGGSQDEMKTLADYLGRKPKTDAFYEELGLV